MFFEWHMIGMVPFEFSCAQPSSSMLATVQHRPDKHQPQPSLRVLNSVVAFAARCGAFTGVVL
jgi:hypothetical protein